jgi:hypothetical protein
MSRSGNFRDRSYDQPINDSSLPSDGPCLHPQGTGPTHYFPIRSSAFIILATMFLMFQIFLVYQFQMLQCDGFSGLGMLDGSINANTNEAFSHPPVSSGVQTVPVPSIDEFNVSEGTLHTDFFCL